MAHEAREGVTMWPSPLLAGQSQCRTSSVEASSHALLQSPPSRGCHASVSDLPIWPVTTYQPPPVSLLINNSERVTPGYISSISHSLDASQLLIARVTHSQTGVLLAKMRGGRELKSVTEAWAPGWLSTHLPAALKEAPNLFLML